MRTTRRQELRTNELSQQMDQIGEYFKRNLTMLTIVILGGAAIVSGGFWFYNERTNRVLDGWAKLGINDADADPLVLIDRYKAVAGEKISPALTKAAWLRVGDMAMSELATLNSGDKDGPKPDELIRTGEQAFQTIIEIAPDDPIVCARATLSIGVLQEYKGDFDAARQWYEKVTESERFRDSPIGKEAEFRLAGMTAWSAAEQFPPPPPMILVPPEAGQDNSNIETVTIGRGPTTLPSQTQGTLPPVESQPPVSTTQTPAGAVADPQTPAEQQATDETPAEPAQPPPDGAGG